MLHKKFIYKRASNKVKAIDMMINRCYHLKVLDAGLIYM